MTFLATLQRLLGLGAGNASRSDTEPRLRALEARWGADDDTFSSSPSVGDAMDAMLLESGAYARSREIDRQMQEDEALGHAGTGGGGMPDLFENQMSTIDLFDNQTATTGMMVNPATGLPMIEDTMIDVGGNVFGTSSEDTFSSSDSLSMDDSFGSDFGSGDSF